MANELLITYSSGNTLYALLFNATGQIWNGASFVEPGAAVWVDCDIAMSEAVATSGIYRGTMPAVAAGVYSIVGREQAGALPAVTDMTVGVGRVEWSGTAEVTLTSRASQTSVDDVPTNAELAAALATADDAVLAAIVALNNLSSAQAQAAAAAALNAAIPVTPTADSINALVRAINEMSGTGSVTAISHTVTVQDGSGVLSGVLVQISTDSGMANIIRSGSTNDLGQVTFYLDAGTYYAWCSRAETDFTNPSTITVSA